jgi:AcrR family transcriptional regulator
MDGDMESTVPSSRRSYTMTARARSMEQTRTRVLQACVDLHGERLAADISLEDVAGRAGVSVQTVLRHFGSRAGLDEEAIRHATAAVVEERRTPVGDPEAAVTAIVEHYEARGDAVLLMLAQERSHDLMARVAAHGREVHQRWVHEVFAPQLAEATDPTALADLLVVATDLSTWKLLRRDRGLGRAATESRIRLLLAGVLHHASPRAT